MDTPVDTNPAAAAPAARKARQCNADYRWTMPKVTAFLEALALCGCVAEAARRVGMSRQSAYRLRARLAGTRFVAAFDGARKQGFRARFAASQVRAASRWDGPGLAAIVALHRASGSAAQGVAVTPQSDGAGAQGDMRDGQGDASAGKATVSPLDSVTRVTGARESGTGRLASAADCAMQHRAASRSMRS